MARLTIRQQTSIGVIRAKAAMRGYAGIKLLCNAIQAYAFYSNPVTNTQIGRKEIQAMIDSLELAYDMLEEREQTHG